MQRMLDKVPSAVFEKGIRGVREYSVGARATCIGVKFLEYSLAGMACGLIGQGIANSAMMARRAGSPDGEFAVDPPPLLKTALVWGLFMGASSNLRYQAVFGLERLVDGTIARRVPQVRRSLPFLFPAPAIDSIACPLGVLFHRNFYAIVSHWACAVRVLHRGRCQTGNHSTIR